MRFGKPKQPPVSLTRGEALALRPQKNREVKETRLESGVVRLAYPVVLRPWMAALVRRLGRKGDPGVQYRRLELDTLGTAVWDLMDGTESVQMIIDRFAAAYQLHPREAEVSVTRFLRELGRRGLIAFQ